MTFCDRIPLDKTAERDTLLVRGDSEALQEWNAHQPAVDGL